MPQNLDDDAIGDVGEALVGIYLAEKSGATVQFSPNSEGPADLIMVSNFHWPVTGAVGSYAIQVKTRRGRPPATLTEEEKEGLQDLAFSLGCEPCYASVELNGEDWRDVVSIKISDLHNNVLAEYPDPSLESPIK